MGMYNKIKSFFSFGSTIQDLNANIQEVNVRLGRLEANSDDLKILNAKIYSCLLENNPKNGVKDSEFKIFSEYGDDGIIQYLIRAIGIDSKTFIEFGVENYSEANTRFLLINNNWKGLIIDGSENNINQVKKENLYWKRDLTAVAKFITRENINEIFLQNGFTGQVGIMHIDVDGNDYWIWKDVNVVDPQLVIMEYNAVFGLNPWTVPYDAKFYRTEKHHSNLYFGASLFALNVLAEKKGYSLVGCNSNGNNAYFVRNDKLSGVKKLSVSDAFVNSMFRESRNASGELTFVSGMERIKLIKGMPVHNIVTGETEII